MTAWNRIEKWLSVHAPDVRQDLGPPATDDEIRAAEQILSIRLPQEAKKVYSIHNGQQGMSFPLAGDWQFLSLEGMVRQWKIQRDLLGKGAFAGAQARAVGPVQETWWSDKWIPVAYNGAGDLHCIDLNPAAGGRLGQIVLYNHDREEREVIAESLSAWLEMLAADFDSGKYVFDDEDGLRRS